MSKMRIHDHEIRNADIFEIMLDYFPDIIHSINEEGNIVFTNRAAESLLGYTRDELLGMNIHRLYPPEILEAVEKGFSDLKKTGDKRVESLLLTKDGRRIPVEIRSFSIYDDSGTFIRTFSILRDLRKIKELEDSLVHAGRLAAIGELASGVVHDINNPLTVILLTNELLQREIRIQKEHGEAEQAERLERLVNDIKRAAESIQKLSQHLRNFARGTAEVMETLDLASTINDAVFMTKSKITKASVTLESDIAKGKFLVTGCANRLEQVFVNLIANACDALKDRPEARVYITVEEDSVADIPCWRVDVTDNGPGVPEECREEIFQSFFTTKPKGEGTGLGLSIARGIAHDHKGDITLTTATGHGTTFSVFLPQLENPTQS